MMINNLDNGLSCSGNVSACTLDRLVVRLGKHAGNSTGGYYHADDHHDNHDDNYYDDDHT